MLGMSIMSARQARLALADHRALEEEAERYNPVNPKQQMGTRRGRTSLVATGGEYTGSGATPSMGLSEFRGGGMSSDEDGEQLVGSGTKKGMMRKTARKAYEGGKKKSDAHETGLHLSKHLQELHGAGPWSAFKDGAMRLMRPVASIAKVAAPLVAPGAGSVVSGALGALGFGKRRGKGKLTITHGGATGAGMLGEDGHGQRKVGAGNVSGPGYEALSGSGMCGRGRSARAAIVKKVMADRGVSMIEASKIVKSEGLY